VPGTVPFPKRQAWQEKRKIDGEVGRFMHFIIVQYNVILREGGEFAA